MDSPEYRAVPAHLLYGLTARFQDLARQVYQHHFARHGLIYTKRFLRSAYQAVRSLGFKKWRVPGVSEAFNFVAVFCLVTICAVYQFDPPAKRYAISDTNSVSTSRELVLLASDGKPFAKRGGCVDARVRFEELPRHFVGALLAMEDRRFFYHPGVDPVGIARAAIANYRRGRIVEGGSTITQQLAKISYLSHNKTFARKTEEAVIALWLDAVLTKKEILERYLSRAYFGQGCYGLRAAAKTFFGVDVKDLSLSQSAYLVALLRSPTYYTANPEQLRHRQRLVFHSMVETGFLDSGDVPATDQPPAVKPDETKAAGHFADWVASTAKVPKDRDLAPLPVRTTLNRKLQKIAEKAVAEVIGKAGKRYKARQAALVAMRPDGRVLALVGGMNYSDSKFNRATQALRQPGSSFKTFVYLAAMRAGAAPQTITSDEPIDIAGWNPQNYSFNNFGVVPLRTAFASSINTIAVRVSEAVGRDKVIKAARDLGIASDMMNVPSIALGTAEVTLIELTSAYAAFAADAYPVKPWAVEGFGNARPGLARPPSEAGKWKLVSGSKMRMLLSATVQGGTGHGARIGIPAYGKTGTSQDHRDAWFVGFAGNLVVGVWVGNDDNSPMRGVTGGSIPVQIWRRFMVRTTKADKDFSPRVPVAVKSFQRRSPAPGSGVDRRRSLEAALAPRYGYRYAGGGGSGVDFGLDAYGNPVRLFGFGNYAQYEQQRNRRAEGRKRRVMGWRSRSDKSWIPWNQ